MCGLRTSATSIRNHARPARTSVVGRHIVVVFISAGEILADHRQCSLATIIVDLCPDRERRSSGCRRDQFQRRRPRRAALVPPARRGSRQRALANDDIGQRQQARDAGLPICITYQGGEDLIDPIRRPNVFRIGPTDHGMAFRLAEYSIPKGFKFALMTDDSTEGVGGERSLGKAFSHTPEAVAARIRIPADATSVDVQVLQAQRAGATALMVWMRPPAMARVLRAARSRGWTVPVFASIAAEDPVVRQQLSDHPEWLGGVTFAMSRMTSEKGPESFDAFRTAYDKRFGKERVGVRAGGKDVVQIPDWAMYSYDFVHVLASAIELSGATGPSQALVRAMEQAEVQGANGDERAFNEKSHEGVVDDDVFFAAFRNMMWVPVKDDPLSSTLPALPQT